MDIYQHLLVGRETGRAKLVFENLPAKRCYFWQKPGGFRVLGPSHTASYQFQFPVYLQIKHIRPWDQ